MFQIKQAYRYHAVYADGSSRDVGAFSKEGARAVAKYVARLMGCRGESTVVVAVAQIGKHGSPRRIWVEQSQ